jgi:glycosyltransferase involved in cell wall biosynthesis
VAHAFARLGRRVIFESHDFGKDAKHAFFLDFLKSLQSNPRLALVCTTETGTTMYLTAGAPSASVLTLHNGVDSNMFCCAEQNVLSRLFPPLARKIRPIVLYTGSLKTEKGAHLLVQAASRFPEFNFVIIGGTPSEIRGLTGSRSTPSNLFLHQSVSFRSIPSILSEANILTMPYQATGEFTPYMSSLKMFEYLASGNPIVSADLPVLRPVLKHGKNSFLYTPESLEGFGDALRIVSSLTPEQRTAVREAQLRTASEHTCDARAKQILSWYATRIQGKTECHP